jgi:enoyl-CoA hydratase
MEKVRFEAAGGIGRILLDDGKVNAMDGEFFTELNLALDRAEGEGVRALVVRGREGFFSAGLNVKLLPSLGPKELDGLVDAFARTILRVFTFPCPTVAACTGHAIAGGALLAFACDLRFMLDGPFKVQMNEVAAGLALPSWALLVAQTAIPPRRHAELLLHARACSPGQAVQWGLFAGAPATPEALDEAASGAARELLALDGTAYGETKLRMRTEAVERVLALLPSERPNRLPFRG